MIRAQECNSGKNLLITEAAIDFTFFCSSVDIVVTISLKNNTTNYVDQAELAFPLVEGSFVCGYAVDIDGVMIPAQIATKEKARKTYAEESQTFHKSKTSIVEQEGNVYKIKLNCLPSNCTRQVRLNIMHQLESIQKDEIHYSCNFPFQINGKCKLKVSSTVLNLTHLNNFENKPETNTNIASLIIENSDNSVMDLSLIPTVLGNCYTVQFEKDDVFVKSLRYHFFQVLALIFFLFLT